MASIYKRGKVWWIHWKNTCGHRSCESLKTRDKTVANRLRKHYEIEERRASLQGNIIMESIGLDLFVAEYLRVRRGQVAPKTLARYRQALQSLGTHIGDNVHLTSIRPTDIENWRSAILDIRSEATANCLLRHVKAAFNYAVEYRYLKETPARYVRPVRETTKPLRILSQDETRKLLASLPTVWADLVRAALYTGARSGELCRLMPDDIDLTVPAVTIRSTPSAPTKSKKSRIVPLPDASIDLFRKLQTAAEKGTLLKNPNGYQWTVDGIAGRFPKLAKKCGIACTFHDLRRTYGAWLVMTGADLVTVQTNLGHSDIFVTVKHYAQVAASHRAEQVNRLPAI